jgi:triosephosphate isomerase
MRDRFVIANLKMQWRGVEEAKAYLRAFSDFKQSSEARVQIVLCGPFVFLERMRLSASETIAIGAQDVFWDDVGAYTGDISAPMLSSIGVRYVLVGHSERRIYNDETDADVMQKLRAVVRSDLTPIVCVGETKDERDEGKTDSVLAQQLQILNEVDWIQAPVSPIIAYEPRWAIGGHETPSQEELVVVTGGIRSVIEKIFGARSSDVKILYGGSVSRENARSVSIEAGLDGILAGRVSLRPETLMALVASLEA